MSDVVIRTENLGKLYHIGAREPYKTLVDTLSSAMSYPFRAISSAGRKRQPAGAVSLHDKNTIWALKDISLEVKHGDVLGLIGRNGAGKTTLLKIISRITEPTEGYAEMHGRVGALLEVGTGFHPELTGRENIYLNGSILGMKRSDIGRKFDEIVAFAEIEKFLDTPVKRYSSGMYMRLAFSIAAHLEPEILVVDEVLAVGDSAFQKKCLGKMGDVASEGRTVLFVSHNMQAVLRLCKRVVILDHGRIVKNDFAQNVIDNYVNSGLGTRADKFWNEAEAPGDDMVRLRAVRVRDKNGHPTDTIEIRDPMSIDIEYTQLRPGTKPTVGVHFWNGDGICLFASYDFNNTQWFNHPRVPGIVRTTCWIPGNFLAEGRISVEIHMNNYFPVETHLKFDWRDIVSFRVLDLSEGDGVRGPVSGGWTGVVRPMLNWTVDVQPAKQQSEVRGK